MIVFDLEWNSGLYEKLRLNEILQISAVKKTGKVIDSTFNAYIRPKAHKRWSPAAEALPILEDCRSSQLDFQGAMAAFQAWCGEDRVFGTWGENDFQVLRENLDYWKVDFPLPETFVDLQAAFSLTAGAKGAVALRYAVEYCSIPDIFDFHDAQGDALYTALVAEWLSPEALEEAERIPGVSSGRRRLSSGLPKGRNWKGPFQDQEELRANRGCRLAVCPVCGVRTRVGTWAGGEKGPYYASFSCPDHGPFLLRLETARSNAGALWGSTKVLPLDQSGRARLRSAQGMGQYPCGGTGARRRKGRGRKRRRKKPAEPPKA